MALRSDLKLVLLFWLLLLVDASRAQEPAFLGGGQSVRYEETRGYFHYLWPCKVEADGSRVANSVSGGTAALCWPIRASRVATVDGKSEMPAVVEGVLMVSATQVRFLPASPKDVDYKSDSSVASVLFRHERGKVFAVLSMTGGVYQFAFNNFCVECTRGAPPLDPNKQAQLDGEYSEFGESLKEFDVVSKRIGDMASLVRLQIRPSNQPSTEDRPDAMALYSKLNGGLAESCPEPARSCLRSYEAYQTCEAGAGSKECGIAPSCTAVCAVAPQVIRGLKAGVCESPSQDSASLFPDWSEVLKKEDVERATNPQGKPGVPKENTDPGSCSVLGEYRLAQTQYYVEKGVRGGVMGGGGGTAPEGHAEKGPGVIRVSGAVAQGILLNRVDPVYPAVARAAHVTGSVVLHAIISKEGKVVEVTAVSGPDLLRPAAVTAVSQWVYKPYLLNGTPTAVDTLVIVNFNFEGATNPPSSTTPAEPH